MLSKKEKLESEIKEEFNVLSRVVFAWMNGLLRPYNEFANSDGLFTEEHVTGEDALVKFYEADENDEIHGAIIVSREAQSNIIPKRPPYAERKEFEPRQELVSWLECSHRLVSSILPTDRHIPAYELNPFQLASKKEFGLSLIHI